jgi:HD superfamily phosphohydrolase YqeK
MGESSKMNNELVINKPKNSISIASQIKDIHKCKPAQSSLKLEKEKKFNSIFDNIQDRVLLSSIYSDSDLMSHIKKAIELMRDKKYEEASKVLKSSTEPDDLLSKALLKHILDIDQRSKDLYRFLKTDVLNLPTRLCGILSPTTKDVSEVKKSINMLNDSYKEILLFFLNDLKKNGSDRYQKKAERLLQICQTVIPS